MKEKVNIKNHFHEFKLLLEQLTYVGVTYTHDDNVETILNNSIISIIMTLNNQIKVTLQDVIAKLLIYNICRKKKLI
jgi:hypothetical protein